MGTESENINKLQMDSKVLDAQKHDLKPGDQVAISGQVVKVGAPEQTGIDKDGLPVFGESGYVDVDVEGRTFSVRSTSLVRGERPVSKTKESAKPEKEDLTKTDTKPSKLTK